MNLKNSKVIYYILIAVIFTGGLIFWISDLESDPPMHYAGNRQSLSTDSHHYVFHARNKILFDDFDPFDYPKWTVFQHTLVSLTSYIIFKASEVSLKNANITGVILNLTGLIFFIMGMLKHHKPLLVSVFSICYLLNISLVVHARLPYLENGLIFYSAILFYLYSRYENRLCSIVTYGIIIALATFTGKLFGALLLPVMVLTIIFSESKNRFKKTVFAAFSFLISSALLVYFLYGNNYRMAFGYLSEQSYGLKGFPKGLQTPWEFFEHLISYGFVNRLFFNNIDFSLFLLAGGFFLTYFMIAKNKLSQLPPTVKFSLFWIIVVFLGLMPFSYSPIRYGIFLIPAIFIFFFSVSDVAISFKYIKERNLSYYNFIFIFIILWHFLFQIWVSIFYANTISTRLLTWTALPVAIMLTLLIRFLFSKYSVKLFSKAVYAIITIVVFFSISLNLNAINKKLYKEKIFNSLEASNDLKKILSPGAVISGSYGPILTINNNLKSFIHQFGLKDQDSLLFDNQPITHLALEKSGYIKAIEHFPQLKDAIPITSYWIRNFNITILNITKISNNEIAKNYVESGFEKARRYFREHKLDSTVLALNNLTEYQKNTKSAGLFALDVMLEMNQEQEAIDLLNPILVNFPTDFSIYMKAGNIMHVIGLQNQDKKLINASEKLFRRAVELNPYKSEYASQIFQQNINQYKKNSKSTK